MRAWALIIGQAGKSLRVNVGVVACAPTRTTLRSAWTPRASTFSQRRACYRGWFTLTIACAR